jgi:hypothetical protein
LAKVGVSLTVGTIAPAGVRKGATKEELPPIARMKSSVFAARPSVRCKVLEFEVNKSQKIKPMECTAFP